MSTVCVIGYVPPARIVGATAFYENIRRFKHKHDLLLYSDPDSAWDDTLRLKMSPEAPFPKGKPHEWAINNVLWFHSMKAAYKRGYSHALYLEADCRVGCDNWDERIFDEYFSSGKAAVCGGSIYVYNCAHWGLRALQRFQRLVVENKDGPVPISAFGWKAKGADVKFPSCVFPNGALGIYSLAWMHELFDLTQMAGTLASHPEPFDLYLGRKLFERFEDDVYEVVAHLNCIYSGYGDATTNLDQRKALLTSGRCCAVHQIKDSWGPL